MEFRQKVEKVRPKKHALLLKVKYLTAARTSEIITSVSPSDLQSTKPYGTFLKWRLEDYKDEKVLVLKMAIAKRKSDEIVFRNIGIPCNRKYEPWTLDLLNYIKDTGSAVFDLTRQRVRQIVKKWFPYPKGIKRKRKNILRHFRMTHLSDYYGFNAEELITYAGWTFSSQFRSAGQLDTYIHLDWRKYFPKLLKKVK